MPFILRRSGHFTYTPQMGTNHCGTEETPFQIRYEVRVSTNWLDESGFCIDQKDIKRLFASRVLRRSWGSMSCELLARDAAARIASLCSEVGSGATKVYVRISPSSQASAEFEGIPTDRVFLNLVENYRGDNCWRANEDEPGTMPEAETAEPQTGSEEGWTFASMLEEIDRLSSTPTVD